VRLNLTSDQPRTIHENDPPLWRHGFIDRRYRVSLPPEHTFEDFVAATRARTGWDLELRTWLLNLDADELMRRIESHLPPRA
jgi:hypothetical protein